MSGVLPCDFTSLAAPGVQGLKPYQPGKPESELQREYGLTDIVKLASNENPLGPSPLAMAAVRDCLPELARYPDGNGFELKRALANRHDVGPEMITLGNGSNDVLELVGRAFLTPENGAVFSAHAFAVYYLTTQAIGARTQIAAGQGVDSAMPYGHDLAAMRAAIDADTRVVFFANPNNPTGTWVDATDLEGFLHDVPAQVLVLIDEAYFEYVERAEYASALPWIERYPNLIVTRTFSKAYGLAGLRVGYSVSTAEVADLLNRVRQPFNVNQPALVGAVAALDDNDYLGRSRALNRRGMTQLQQGLDRFGLSYLPSLGNFLCVNVGRSGDQVFAELLPKGVIVRPVVNYGLPDFVRITVGTEAENDRALAALADVL